ncbi:hypothetical protein KI387_015271 [Taxus chinensis]|uniref:Uncharacterized protein n=1 Tax=Taxus chinensis TaxID=29808 RepID=A0AA38LH77_TAXCH|nr:hypothetical protein KI387_015271 [Taxus chinensis]
MAPLFSCVFVGIILALTSAATAFDDSNYIDMVTDKFGNVETDVFQLLGTTPKALKFADFALRYEKKYGSISELVQRYNVFLQNVELIESSNSMNLPYTLGINEFADLTWEEFQGQFLGASQNCSATKSNHKLTDVQLPETKDWREIGIVSPVKDQASCGSCWTFSTTGALEAAYKQATGKSVILSEQQLVDCAGAFNNFGCSGGLPSQAFEYIKYNGGLDTEDSYPYTAKNGVCKYDVNNVGAKVVDVVNITMGAEDELKHAVGLVRPVSVAFQVIKDFRFYKGGVFTSNHCAQGPMDVNHAVLAVGYGVSEEGTPYWIIKNSWGGSWGVDGYFNMEMGKNMGLNGGPKQRMLKELRRSSRPSILLIQEMKMKTKVVEECKKTFWENAAFATSDSQGASGGLAVFWDTKIIHGNVLFSSQNYLAINFNSLEKNSSWILSNIYAPNTTTGRRNLWKELAWFGNNFEDSNWLIMGDFNTPLNPREKFGGNSDFSNNMEDFVDFISYLNLMDIELHGNQYTWSNRRIE